MTLKLNRLTPWFYVVPALIILIVYLVYPVVNTVYLSLFNRDSQQFVGLENYVYAFSDAAMRVAFGNNVLWLVLGTLVTVTLGLVLAVLTDRVRYESLVKSIIFVPMAISFVAASVIWKFVYAWRVSGASQIGLLNALLTLTPNGQP